MAVTEKMRNRSKHVDIKYHNVREAIKEKLIELQYCKTEQNVADIMMKPLKSLRCDEITKELGMISVQV